MNILILAVENTNRNQYRYAAVMLEQNCCDLVRERANAYEQMRSLLPNGIGQVEARYNDRTPVWYEHAEHAEHADVFDPETVDDLGVLAKDTLDQGMVIISDKAIRKGRWPVWLTGKMVFTVYGVHWEVYNSSGELEQTLPVNPRYLVVN